MYVHNVECMILSFNHALKCLGVIFGGSMVGLRKSPSLGTMELLDDVWLLAHVVKMFRKMN